MTFAAKVFPIKCTFKQLIAMKRNTFGCINKSTRVLCATLVATLLTTMIGCDGDDPIKEDVPELITKATLTFTPPGAGAGIVVTATDPDGEGVQDLVVDGPINLTIATTYILTIDLINGLASPTSAEYDVDKEVAKESDEHMFFFAWTDDVFENPVGDGNADNRDDAVNYNDKDSGGLPLGLSTTWRSSPVAASGTFRVLLKHQPNLKSATSTSATGESDLDITFTISVE
jgi:hypothetical protein